MTARESGNIGEYMAALLASPFARQVADHRVWEPRAAEYGDVRRPWPAAVRDVLSVRGLEGLYRHQAEAADVIRAGQDLMLATPTASGKTLAYSLPFLEAFLRDPDTSALWLFPLKALARDQLAAFERLTEHWPKDARPRAAIYDGDCGDSQRRKIRNKPPNVLITNPEMLHLAILPYHGRWATFLASLHSLVLDEAHTFRGVQGAHMAQLLQRLQRICTRYGPRPAHILCSATVGNPAELAGNLIGPGSTAPVVVNRSGAPTGKRHFVFVNPEMDSISQSASAAAIDLLRAALARNLRTIVYCRSRRMTESLAMWAADKAGPWASRISAYRAGFLPEERREIEERMSSGDLLAVISTSALELGIDIGALDLCILVGYPGTVMSTLQRGGRVGRSGRESAVVLIGGEDALDQYFMRNPDAFFSRDAELAVLNPYNEVILSRHVECAAAENPLRLLPPEPWLQIPQVQAAFAELEQQGRLLRTADGAEAVAARKRPQREVSLRGCGQSFTILDEHQQPLGTVDGKQAYFETHPGALYLHHGRSYEIASLDPAARTVHAKLLSRRPGWFTRVRSSKVTEILSVTAQVAGSAACFPAFHGRLRVTETLTGYEKRSLAGNRLLGIVPFATADVPPFVFETEGLWFTIPDTLRRAAEDSRLHFMGGIHALEHVCIGLMPLLVMADRNDFGGISIPFHAQLAAPAVFVYDGLPGGAGLSTAAYPRLPELFDAVQTLLENCPCETGCPSCVHSPKCGSGNRPIDKEAALFLVRGRSDSAGSTLCVSPPAPLIPAQDETTTAPANSPTASESLSAQFPASYVVFDVETRRSAEEVGGWNHAGRMGVSVAVLYDSRDDTFVACPQDNLGPLFERMRSADLVVGFNSQRFDYTVLQPFAPFDLHTLPTLDLLTVVYKRLSYRVSLGNLAEATLGVGKSADGLAALRWWQEGKTDLIEHYCRQDVAVTRDLYRFAMENRYMLFTNKGGNVVRCVV